MENAYVELFVFLFIKTADEKYCDICSRGIENSDLFIWILNCFLLIYNLNTWAYVFSFFRIKKELYPIFAGGGFVNAHFHSKLHISV